MAFPRKLLNEGEELVLDLKPHWIYVLPCVSSLVVAVVAGIIVISLSKGTLKSILGPVVGIALLVIIVWFIVRYLQWVTTQFVVTGDRIISRRGVLSKAGIEIPLERINTVKFNQRLVERMVGAGDLTIESASTNGSESFTNIRHPDNVQREIYVQMEKNSHRPYKELGDQTAQALAQFGGGGGGMSVAEQLEKLDELRRNGVLSEAEFQAQKSRLLST